MKYFDTYSAVPEELKQLRQWVIWCEEIRDNKPTKIPYQINGQTAKSNDAATWTDFQTAAHTYQIQRVQANGIGFVFSPTDPYCGIDLDDCIDENQNIKTWAKPIVDKLTSVGYGEVSPSGYGIKFWTRAQLPDDTKHKVYVTTDGIVCPQGNNTAGEIEAYDTVRYFTITGKGKYSIRDGQHVIEWLYEKYLKPQPKPYQAQNHKQVSQNLSNDGIIEKIRQSRQCHKFEALMHGNTTGYGSESEADIALCAVIAFWTQDINTIDTIFRQSELMRPKWDEKHRADGATYGQMTIEAAIANQTQTYTPRKRKYTGQARARIATQLNRYFGRRR